MNYLFVNQSISILLILVYIITSSITTFDKRLIQARKAGAIPASDPMLPSWVAGVYWIHYPLMVLMLIINWQFALGLIITGFLCEVFPVWETIGNILMSRFRQKT